MKRGISPLVSWVLLIGFSVAAGILITQWAISIAQNVEFPEDKETYCNEVQLDVESICLYDGEDKAHITLKNNGAFTIKRIGFGRETTLWGKEWCIYLIPSVEWITPGGTQEIIFEAGSSNDEYNPLGDTDCNGLTGGTNFIPGTYDLLELEIIPWIKPGEEAIQCFEKGILLNTAIEYC
ncbi:hypothetical protein HOC06_01010 [Candidatus Woesearchaeota archaeon]|jgi:hypothetical protein|nr:hypothetical protein [Candidatus Woesearchaeota archaeon]